MKYIEPQNVSETQGISLRELWSTALKRKGLVIATSLAVFLVVAVISFMIAPKYTAEGQILIEREPKILNFEEVFQIETFNDDFYQTQYKLLQSRTLAGDTIERMRLYENEAFAKTVTEKTDPGAVDFLNDPAVRRKFISEFLKRLNVRPIKKTRLVQASFSDADPKLAADILNTFFDAYIEMNLLKKSQTTEQASDFLTNQIQDVQNRIEADEKKLQDYGKSKNILAMNSTENTVIEKLGELNKAMTGAQIDRINKETYYNEIKIATPDYIPDALSNTLIQTLREEYNRVQREYATRSETYLPDYPEIQSLKAELETAKKALEDETQALIKRAYSDFQTALARERALTDAFNKQKREAFQLNSNAIQYNSLLIQVQNEKDLLESLLKRKSESDVSSNMKGLRMSNIWVVDRAEIPSSPSSPNKTKNMVLGLMIGLFAGLGLALLSESLDNTLKNSADVRKHSGMPMLGVIPAFNKNGLKRGYGETEAEAGAGNGDKPRPAWALFVERFAAAVGMKKNEANGNEQESLDLLVHFFPKSSFSEHYRSIRTRLLFSPDDKIRAFAITSPMPGEGKTVTVCNVAVTLAQTGKRVVIIDADLRKPRLHKVFRVKNLNGLTKYLSADLDLEDLLRATSIPTLSLINSGPVPPNPAELLGSEKMARLILELKDSFDFILVDTPPVLAVSDALSVGARLDGVILVVRGGKTTRDALKKAKEDMEVHEINCLGVVLNNVPLQDYEDQYYRAYYGYRGRTGA